MANSDRDWATYNSIDGAVTYKIRDVLNEPIDAQGYRDLYNRTMELYPLLFYMSTRGIRVNEEARTRKANEVATMLSEKKAELNVAAGGELNALSPKQCIEYFYGELGITPYKNKGVPTTDDKALARIARKDKVGSKEARIVQLIRALNKLSGTYLEATADADGRLRCSWNPRGTKNQRFSSSQTIFGTGLNLQNLHSLFKEFLTADDGNLLIELDKAKSEWVITAYVCGDSKMIQVIESGQDIHAFTGSQISGLPIEIVAIEDDILGHLADRTEIDRVRRENIPELYDGTFGKIFLPPIFSCRQGGKKSNHGCNYIMGYRRFAMENEMEENVAKPIVEGYRESYPGLVQWWDWVIRRLQKDRILVNCYDDPRRFLGNLRDPHTHMDGVAYNPQSTNARMINDAMRAMWKETGRAAQKIDHLAQVHDSVLFQYPIKNWSDMASAILKYRKHLEPELKWQGREFTVATDIKVGLNWGDFHKKDNLQGMREIKFPTKVKDLAGILEAEYGKASG